MPDHQDPFIDEAFLKRLEKLKVMTRKSPTSPQRGVHRSWRSGEGFEFLDYRKYHPGDDLRYVDWSVYGRLDKLFIKLFHAEKGQTTHILLDMSRSMGLGRPAKALIAKKIAAAIAYISLANLNKTGLMAFNRDMGAAKTPVRGKKHFTAVLDYLTGLVPERDTRFNHCLSQYAANCINPGVAVVISDLFAPGGYEEGLKALAYRNFDINLIHTMDHNELYWPHTGYYRLRDTETGAEKTIFVDRRLQSAYEEKIRAFIAEARRYCSHYGINYFLADTSVSFETLLIRYLTRGALFG